MSFNFKFTMRAHVALETDVNQPATWHRLSSLRFQCSSCQDYNYLLPFGHGETMAAHLLYADFAILLRRSHEPCCLA